MDPQATAGRRAGRGRDTGLPWKSGGVSDLVLLSHNCYYVKSCNETIDEAGDITVLLPDNRVRNLAICWNDRPPALRGPAIRLKDQQSQCGIKRTG